MDKPTPSIKETISAHDEGEDLPRMGGSESSICKALREAATSLETIGRLAGLGEFMLEDSEVRAYANSRAGVARAALSAAPQSDGWMPIESAPEKGEFLVYMPQERVRIQVAKWHPNVKTIGGSFDFDLTAPTHWHPLPQIPQAQGQNHVE